MDRIRIRGGNRLTGTIAISGAKNAALPLMIAGLLTPETLTLHQRAAAGRCAAACSASCRTMASTSPLPASAPARTAARAKHCASQAKTIVDTTAPYELVSKMRASFWVLGPLLARCGEAKVSLPGGCAIGTQAGRSAPHGDGEARRRDRDRGRLCGRQGAARASRAAISPSRRFRSAPPMRH